jgi:hypothetical protein
MLDSFCPVPRCLTIDSPIVPSVFVNATPRVLVTKTKNNQSQGWEATLLKVLYFASCLGTDGNRDPGFRNAYVFSSHV